MAIQRRKVAAGFCECCGTNLTCGSCYCTVERFCRGCNKCTEHCRCEVPDAPSSLMEELVAAKLYWSGLGVRF